MYKIQLQRVYYIQQFHQNFKLLDQKHLSFHTMVIINLHDYVVDADVHVNVDDPHVHVHVNN